ncbi:unnamed protein product [Lampetra fluviatilis]
MLKWVVVSGQVSDAQVCSLFAGGRYRTERNRNGHERRFRLDQTQVRVPARGAGSSDYVALIIGRRGASALSRVRTVFHVRPPPPPRVTIQTETRVPVVDANLLEMKRSLITGGDVGDGGHAARLPFPWDRANNKYPRVA